VHTFVDVGPDGEHGPPGRPRRGPTALRCRQPHPQALASTIVYHCQEVDTDWRE
jgi:hypothetical protein